MSSKGLGKIFLHGTTVHVGPNGMCNEEECKQYEKQGDDCVCSLTGDEILLIKDGSGNLMRHETCLVDEYTIFMKGYKDLKKYHEKIPPIEKLDDDTKVLLIKYAEFSSEPEFCKNKHFKASTLLDFILTFVDWNHFNRKLIDEFNKQLLPTIETIPVCPDCGSDDNLLLGGCGCTYYCNDCGARFNS